MQRVDGAKVGRKIECGCVEGVLADDVRVARTDLLEQDFEPTTQRVASGWVGCAVRADRCACRGSLDRDLNDVHARHDRTGSGKDLDRMAALGQAVGKVAYDRMRAIRLRLDD